MIFAEAKLLIQAFLAISYPDYERKEIAIAISFYKDSGKEILPLSFVCWAYFYTIRSKSLNSPEQKQVIAYQLELFGINGQGAVYPFLKREAISSGVRQQILRKMLCRAYATLFVRWKALFAA